MILNQEELQEKWDIFFREISVTEESTVEVNHLEDFCTHYDTQVQKKAQLESLSADESSNIYVSDSAHQKYLVLSDLHIPFHISELYQILESYGNKSYDLILAGDMVDCYDISVFPKSKSVGLSNEINILKELLVKCSKLFRKVYLISGNHSRRLASYIRKRLNPEVSALVQDDIIEYITSSLKLNNVYYTPGDTKNWFIQIDNVVLAHPDTYKKSILGTALDTYHYFDARGTSASVFMIGHTHALGMTCFKNRVLIETGCTCLEQDYSMSGNLAYMPQQNGFVVFQSNDNKVTFNDIKLISI